MNAGLVDLWTSGATDAFGYRFRDVWSVRGWEEGRVPEGYVSWLNREPAPAPQLTTNTTTKQMELFA